jgi:hypothetical protein
MQDKSNLLKAMDTLLAVKPEKMPTKSVASANPKAYIITGAKKP